MSKTTAASTAGCDWNKNNLACTNTWAFLRGLGQLRPAFSDSKDIRMSELAFWNPAASSESRKLEARALASQLDRIFTKSLLAKYETGFNFAKAVDAMVQILTSSDRTVCELSVVVDEAYNFKGELK
jgi:hypothetical protein